MPDGDHRRGIRALLIGAFGSVLLLIVVSAAGAIGVVGASPASNGLIPLSAVAPAPPPVALVWPATADEHAAPAAAGAGVVDRTAVQRLRAQRRQAAARKADQQAAARQAAARQAAARQAAAQQAARQAAARQAAREAARQAAARQAAQQRASRSAPRPAPSGDPHAIAQAMLAARGWSGQYSCLLALWDRESGWRVTAQNPASGAYGIPQAYPGSQMAAFGSDWRYSARTQIAWGLHYIGQRYGTPCNAWSFWQAHHWY